MDLSGNSKAIREMLALRACGWTISSLSIHFGKDRTSIRHHLVKYNIYPLTQEVRVKIERPLPPPRVQKQLLKYDFDDEPINPGLTYREYVERAKKRHPKETHHIIPIGRKNISDILVEIL